MTRRRRARSSRWAWLAAALAASGGAAAAEAQDRVVLRLKDSAFEFAGRLRSFDGRSYLIEAGSFGIVALDAARYTCSGAACPASPAIAAAAGASTLVADTMPAGRETETVTIEGSATVGLDLMPALIRDFAVSRGGFARQRLGTDAQATRFEIIDGAGAARAAIALRRNGNTAAFAGLAAGRATLAMVSRAASGAELAAFASNHAAAAASEHVLALDGLAVIVAPDNPLMSLGIEAIAGIFSGRTTNWADLGLRPAPIRVYATSEAGVASDSFEEQVLKPRALTLTAGAVSVPNEAALADRVAADPLAIGVTSLALVRNARALEIAGTCGLRSRATPFSVKAEEYPLSRRLYLYSAGEPKGATAQALMAFAASGRAQNVIHDTQFVDQAIERAPYSRENRRVTRMLEDAAVAESDKARLRNLVAGLLEAERLSITFRFASGSSTLDAKARQDVLRLRELLKGPALKGTTVHLIGFTDSVGSAAANLALSRRRASQVRAAVLARDPALMADKSVLSSGYGHLAPVACNQSAADLLLNRRVEVWVTKGISTARAVETVEKPSRKRRFKRSRR